MFDCLCFYYQHLDNVANEDVRTQIRIFSEHKEEDAEEFSHRYDSIRFEMEYPLTHAVNVTQVFNFHVLVAELDAMSNILHIRCFSCYLIIHS